MTNDVGPITKTDQPCRRSGALLLTLATASWLGFACGGSTTHADPQIAVVQLLSVLRSTLGRQDGTLEGRPPLEPLIGTPQETIRERLGTPIMCTAREAGLRGASIPCRLPGDWAYHFVGREDDDQGPFLILGFDREGSVLRAEWRER